MEELKKAVENRNAPFEFGGKTGTRGRVISLRVSERMEQLLEEQAQEWDMSISDTLRSILNFYFLPPLLLEAWESKVEELVELDTKQRGKNRADLNAQTQAQRIEHVLVDSEEAEEYALFIHELWEKSLKYFETLREEASTMNKIAEERLLKTAKAFRKASKKLEEAEVQQ